MKKKSAAITASRRAAPERDVVGLAARGRGGGGLAAGGEERGEVRRPKRPRLPPPSIARSPARRARKRAAATAGKVLARRPTMVVELAESEIRTSKRLMPGWSARSGVIQTMRVSTKRRPRSAGVARPRARTSAPLSTPTLPSDHARLAPSGDQAPKPRVMG